MRYWCSALVGAVFFLYSAAQPSASNLTEPTYPLSPVEQLYADLFKLEPQARHKKLVEGAEKEAAGAKFEIIQAFGGALGRGHTAIFKKAYPFANIAETNLGSNDAFERLLAEERSGRHLTDAMSGPELTEATPSLEGGYLARYPTPAAEKILPKYRTFFDPHNRWLLTHWSEQGMSFNNRLLKPADAPKAWMDLCDPKYKGQVSFEPLRVRFLVFLKEMMGEAGAIEFMKCMGRNEPILMTGQTVRLELMLAGDHAIQGLNFLYRGTMYVHQRGADKVPFSAVYSAPILASGAGCVINRFTQRPHTAALYCDWHLDEEPQAYIKSNYRGTVTLDSAFMPSDVQLVPLFPQDLETVNRLTEAWKQYVLRN